VRAHGLNLPDPPASSRVHQCRRAACLERFPSRDARPPYGDGAIVLRQPGGRDAEWRLRAPVGSLATRPSQHCSSVRFADRPVPRSRKSGGVSLPRRVPSPRSGCVNEHWRFVPRSGCSHESATTRRAGGRVASRKPISGAQRPQLPLGISFASTQLTKAIAPPTTTRKLLQLPPGRIRGALAEFFQPLLDITRPLASAFIVAAQGGV